MSNNITAEVAIIGSGPSGFAASYTLSKAGVSHLLFDKDVFPRDKICGDGLSPKVLNCIYRLDPKILEDMADDESRFTKIGAGMAVAPNLSEVIIPINPQAYNQKIPAGFVSKRIVFDDFLVKRLTDPHTVMVHGANVTLLNRTADGVEITYTQNGEQKTAFVKAIIGADGDRSIVKKTFAPRKMEPAHYCAGLRAYYTGVTGMHKDGALELHFLNKSLPGYFWIFPLPEGGANVGIGMISSYVSKNKVNLREVMLEAIKNEPHLKDRFKDATLDGKIAGWGLPMGSKLWAMSGDRFILAGDAASLIDPISGEGIGNALNTGRYAADAILEARKNGDAYTAADLNFHYDKRIRRTMGIELKMSTFFQKAAYYPRLLSFIFGIVRRNKVIIETLADLYNGEFHKKILNPMFTLRILGGFFR
jgi:geranylgeranyl reductase family protein